MKLRSKNSLASTYDNVEAIFKRILIFISEIFDKMIKYTDFREARQESYKIPVIGQVILLLGMLTVYSWLLLIATDIHKCINDVIAITYDK